MSDTPRSSKHASRTPKPGGEGTGRRAPGPDAPEGGRRASRWVGAAGEAASSKASSKTPSSKTSSSRAAGTKGPKGAAAESRAARRTTAAVLNYPRAGTKRGWRWIPSLRMILGAAALLVIAGVGVLAWLYQTTEVPEPSDVAVAQTSRVYFNDGTTEMGTYSDINRTIIPSDQIPDTVKNAVVASEDSTFYENRGVSPRGIVRALVNNLRGGARQGGSTITQQYVERYYTGTNTSYAGKVKEMIMALKIDQELSKEEILSRYLNTIYFGRGAYGIQAAAQAYFGKDAKDLTEGEAAVLVALIPAPSAYDPAVNPDKATQLWKRVIDREVNETKALTPEQADAIQYPQTVPPAAKNRMGGTNGYLVRLVQRELVKQGMTEDELNRGGFTIVTTIDPAIQDHTVKAVEDLPDDRPAKNRVGTVTLDPSTGAIKGMYGGPDYVERSYNDAVDSHMQAGSIFKTFTLVAALDDGYSLNSTWDGNSPRTFGRQDWTVKNFGDYSYGTISLAEATTDSVNTAYGELNIDMGPEKTKAMAIRLGLPEDTAGLDDYPTNVLGSASPTVMNMAGAYATIAAQGVRHEPYVVQTVTRTDGSVRYEHQDKAEQVLDKDVAINATVALQGPPEDGSARYVGSHMSGRPVAGKTGTSESFRSAWFVGFTPQLVTAVGMFQPNDDGTAEESLTPFGGEDEITGGTFPTELWVGIMKPSLDGQEKLSFPKAVATKSKKGTSSSSTTSTKASTRKATRRSTQAPAPTSEAPAPTQQTVPEPTTEPVPAPEPPASEQPAEAPADGGAPAEQAPPAEPASPQPQGLGVEVGRLRDGV